MQRTHDTVVTHRPERFVDQLSRSRFAVPKVPAAAVGRERLLDLLDRGARGPLTVVSAPAGTGKTVAVAAWVASGRARDRVVWITLGEDADAAQLWSLLAEALHHQTLFDPSTLPEPIPGAPDAFLTALASALAARREPVVLVLDCPVDLPEGSTTELHELLTSAAGRLRLVTLTRADPQLPLHLYRLNETLAEIRIADLAFTTQEARELLARRGATIPPDVVDVLVARTHGWVAGFLLAAMSLAQSPDVREAARHIDGATGPVAEYLLTEVLSRQTPAARDLLLRTSVVETLRPGLTEALAGAHGSDSLGFLTRGNAFLEELPDAPTWYRYHPLFRELLAAQLDYEAPDQGRELHLIAARWLAAEGLIPDAVRTALGVGAWDEATGIVIESLTVAQLLPRPGTERLRTYFRALPATASTTSALLVRAALALGNQSYEDCMGLLERAGRRRDGVAPPSCAQTLTAAVLSAITAARSGAPIERVLATAQHARALLEEDKRAAAHTELLLLVEDAAADALFRAGRFAEAADACRVATAAIDSEFANEQVACLGRLAFIAAWSGHCRRAIRLAERACALQTSAPSSEPSSPLPELARAWAYTETGELARAMQHAAAARIAPSDTTASAALARAVDIIVRARVQRARGDLRGACAALDEGARSGGEAPAWVIDQIVLEEAVVHLLDGQPRPALDLPDTLSGSVRLAASLVRAEAELLCVDRAVRANVRTTAAGDDLALRVHRALLDALFQSRRGDERACTEAIERALRLAAPEHLRRPFHEAPEPVRRALSTRTDLTVRHPWLVGAEPSGQLRRSPVTGTSDDSDVPVEPLTDKESEVLGLLAQLLTTEETAAAMFVSVNTVRTHVRNILRKMGVPGRNQAIRRARDLGILPAA